MFHQAKKVVSYAESGDEDGEVEEFRPTKSTARGRALKRRKTMVIDEDDFSRESEAEEIDEGMSPIELSSLCFCGAKAYVFVKFR